MIGAWCDDSGFVVSMILFNDSVHVGTGCVERSRRASAISCRGHRTKHLSLNLPIIEPIIESTIDPMPQGWERTTLCQWARSPRPPSFANNNVIITNARRSYHHVNGYHSRLSLTLSLGLALSLPLTPCSKGGSALHSASGSVANNNVIITNA